MCKATQVVDVRIDRTIIFVRSRLRIQSGMVCVPKGLRWSISVWVDLTTDLDQKTDICTVL